MSPATGRLVRAVALGAGLAAAVGAVGCEDDENTFEEAGREIDQVMEESRENASEMLDEASETLDDASDDLARPDPDPLEEDPVEPEPIDEEPP